MPLHKLALNYTAVTDLEPLRGMALKHLTLQNTKVTDLKPLQGMPLEILTLRSTAVTDISVLRGMPLTTLRLCDCQQLNDLSPLAEARGLTFLSLPANAKDIEFLRTFPKLERLSFTEGTHKRWLPSQTTAEFWLQYERKARALDPPANASPLPGRE
ncbi:hypothetical protein AYO49_06395 [Verrucomicrobiaceae bacterium SCGC AG-212-N21]|nr:hypothetical protein AYO49_06395 [Verrucomicrobiaceae bacterium SCGC AG-212-N21]